MTYYLLFFEIRVTSQHSIQTTNCFHISNRGFPNIEKLEEDFKFDNNNGKPYLCVLKNIHKFDTAGEYYSAGGK